MAKVSFQVSSKVKVELLPLGVALEAQRGASLQEVLASLGLEFPCGGSGTCGGCRVQVVNGQLEATPEDRALFSADELAAGYRLACRTRAETSITLKVQHSTMPVLVDDQFPVSAGRKGFAIAIDLGTTTIAVQLWDLASGKLCGVRTALNPQAAHGSDLISRLRFALNSRALTPLIRQFLGGMVCDLARGREDQVVEVVLVGNTVMHHLFCGIDIKPLSHAPFQSPQNGERRFVPGQLEWKLPSSTSIRFLPSIGGFVGSDILAGIIATGLSNGIGLRALIDLGTNGEIALGNEERILCASTAAGTAFEAGSITMGMRAASGAISHVFIGPDRIKCSVIGDGEPHGICGSGLVDAVAAGLDLGAILPSGRLAEGAKAFSLAGQVQLSQHDVRQLQLAKGAIASGLRILLKQWGAAMEDVTAIYLSGAFGNYVRPESAVRIGLFETAPDRVLASGNTALRGAKLLINSQAFPALQITEHVSLASDPHFQRIFIDSLAFPQSRRRDALRRIPDVISFGGKHASGVDRV